MMIILHNVTKCTVEMVLTQRLANTQHK